MDSRKRKTPKLSIDRLDIGRLLRPANAFASPMAVVDDQDLTLTEKRGILTAWAADARETALNHCDIANAVHCDDVLAALRELDRRYGLLKSRPRYRRILARRIPGVFGRDDDAGKPGPALN
ncbi:MAG: hypothetical protein GEU95_12720 [Rhizobiales bacterium]|nr:hypothetical protein [Hyphomicrobiales bacterium]